MTKTIKEWQKEAYELATEKGWHEPDNERSFPEAIVLVHSELSEAIEEYRRPNIHQRIGTFEGYYDPKGKPLGIPSELADVVIRVMDLCEQFGIDLEKAIETKHEYNKTRSYRHGNKKI